MRTPVQEPLGVFAFVIIERPKVLNLAEEMTKTAFLFLLECRNRIR